MKSICIDLSKHKNPQGALFRAMRRDPDRIVFIGHDPELEIMAKHSGHKVEVLPVVSSVPDGVVMLIPLMNNLKEFKREELWPFIDTIENDVHIGIHQYAHTVRSTETPESAALLVDAYCDGMVRVLDISGVITELRQEGDRLVREIDPNFDANREARCEARSESSMAAKPELISTQTNDARF